MADCYKRIVGDIENSICGGKYAKGVKNKAYYIDEEDIDKSASVYNGDTNTVTKIVLQSGAKAIRMYMPSSTPYNGIKNEDQNVPIGQAWNKTVPLVLLGDNPENARKITSLKMRKGVVIYEQNSKGDNGEQAYIVVGWENGVSGQNATIDKYNDDTQGGWSIDLIEEDAQTPQIFFFTEDYQTTKEALESMCESE